MFGGLYYWLHWERRWAWGEAATPPILKGDPRVSILVPCFNESRHARSTILAALAQHCQNVEVIAINDGSTDDTGRVLDEMSVAHAGLRVIHLAQNQGKAMALRTGALAASGEYRVCIDGDSNIHPECGEAAGRERGG